MALSLGLKAKGKYLGFMAVGQGLRAIGLFEQPQPGFLGRRLKGALSGGAWVKAARQGNITRLFQCYSITVLQYYTIGYETRQVDHMQNHPFAEQWFFLPMAGSPLNNPHFNGATVSWGGCPFCICLMPKKYACHTLWWTCDHLGQQVSNSASTQTPMHTSLCMH